MTDEGPLILRFFPGFWEGFPVQDTKFCMVGVDGFIRFLFTPLVEGICFFRHRSSQ